MSRRVRLRVEAREELRAARKWYEQRRIGLGRVFAEAFITRVNLIAERPELFAVVRGEVRATTMGQFPYNIYYIVESGTVEVIAVVHSSRDPDFWTLRT